MDNRNSFYHSINDNFKLLTWLLIIFIAITPNFIFIQSANASAAESWTIAEVVYDDIGKNLDYKAKKVGTAANDLIYKARVPVTASATGSTVANMIRLGLAGAAIYGIVEAAGWIIENGLVKKPDPDQVLTNPSYEYLWQSQATNHQPVPTLAQACPTLYSNGPNNYHIKSPPYTVASINTVYCHYYNLAQPDLRNWDTDIPASRVKNPNYNPADAPRFVPVPDSELGQEIIESPNAPQVLPDIYNPNNPAGGAAPSQTREALDNANPEPVTQPEGETSPRPNVDTDGDGVPDEYSASEPTAGSTFKLPKFCEWAPAVCDFFTVQKKANTDFKDNQTKAIEQDKTFFDKVTYFFDWSKEQPIEESDTLVNVDQSTIIFDDSSKVTFSNSCPAPEQINIDFQGITQNIEFSYTPLCNFLSMIKPFVVASSYLIGAYIVMGLSRGSSD